MTSTWFVAFMGVVAACGGDDGETSDGADAASDSSGDTSATDATADDDVADDDDDAGTSSAGSTGVSAGTDSSGAAESSEGESTAADTGAGGTFDCGPDLQGSLDTEDGQETIGGALDSGAQYACMPLPKGCAPAPSCACLAETGCGEMCVESPDGGLMVTCLAP